MVPLIILMNVRARHPILTAVLMIYVKSFESRDNKPSASAFLTMDYKENTTYIRFIRQLPSAMICPWLNCSPEKNLEIFHLYLGETNTS
jgi:hypothetical protein